MPLRLQTAHRSQPGRTRHRRGDHPANESDIKKPCNAVGESGLGTRHYRDGGQGLRLVGEHEGAFLHEAERPHHAQGAKEPQPHGTRKGREQGRKQGALCRGKDIRFDAQVVRGRGGKICGAGQDARAAHHGGYRLQLVPNAGDYCVQSHQIREKQG